MKNNFINHKRKLLVACIVSVLLGGIAKFYYFDNNINLKANKINSVWVNLKNADGSFDSKKYYCDNLQKEMFVKTIKKFESGTLPNYHFLIGNISFNFNSTETIIAQISSSEDKIYIKIGKDVFSGKIDLNEFFKELNLIFGRYSGNDIKTIQLKIKKGEENPYFLDGGIFEPKKGSFDQIVDRLKKSKIYPICSLMSYGDFIIETKSGVKYKRTLLHYENNLFFVEDCYYYVDNKILEFFEEIKQ